MTIPENGGPWGYGEGPLYKLLKRIIDGLPDRGPGWWGRVKARWSQWQDLLKQAFPGEGLYDRMGYLQNQFSGIWYALLGTSRALETLQGLVDNDGVPDVSEKLAALLRSAVQDPKVKEIVESLGAAVTEPILALFESYAGRDDLDPKEFARSFHGIMIGLNTVGGLADTALETATGGQVEGAGRFLESMYWSLGLGFLGWQTLAPLLESGLQPGLDRYYKKLYRPARFSAGDLRDLYALGKLTPEQMREEARALGWRDEDIAQWLQLAFRTLSQGDVFAAWHDDLITQEEAVRRLRVLGYDPQDIPLLFQLNPKEAVQEEKAVTLTTARNAYREHLIGADEFSALLADLGKPEQEIQLILALEDARAQTEARGLSVAQVKAAWEENVLGDTEATHWLEQAGLSGEKIGILLETWKAELVPQFRKLNAGTITGAYVEGVIARGVAVEKLSGVGFSPEDADLELKLAEIRNPQAFGQIAPPEARRLSPGLLSDLVALGLITPAQMAERLVTAGYSSEDANLLAEAARLRSTPGSRRLSQSTIQAAYLAGVIERQTALEELNTLGFGNEQAGIILDTLERENPGAFGLPPEERVRELSPSTLEDLYLGDVISQERYIQGLLALGFSEEDTGALVIRAEQFKQPGQRTITQSTIERAYLAGVFDRARAFDKLVVADFDPEDANTILDTIERENPASFTPGLVQSLRTPSITVLVAALRNGILSEAEYFARAAELGYQTADAELYLAVAATNERKSTRALTTAQILEAYRKGLFTRGTTLARLNESGYSNEDAVLLIRMEKDVIENTDTWDALLSGALDPFDAIAALISANYSDGDILEAFGSLPAQVLSSLGIDLAQLQSVLAEIPGGA